jgi:hypothetical protein
MSLTGAAVSVLLVISSLHHLVLVSAGAGLLASHWVDWLPGRCEGTAWALPHRGLVPRSMTSTQTSCPACARPRSHDGDAGPCSALRSHDHPVTFVGAEVNRTGWSELGPAFGWFAPGRLVHVPADAAYHGPALGTLPENVTWTCRIPRNAVPYSLVRPAPASAAGPAPRETGPARPMTSPPPRAGRGSPSPPTADKRTGTSPRSPARGTVPGTPGPSG